MDFSPETGVVGFLEATLDATKSMSTRLQDETQLLELRVNPQMTKEKADIPTAILTCSGAFSGTILEKLIGEEKDQLFAVAIKDSFTTSEDIKFSTFEFYMIGMILLKGCFYIESKYIKDWRGTSPQVSGDVSIPDRLLECDDIFFVLNFNRGSTTTIQISRQLIEDRSITALAEVLSVAELIDDLIQDMLT